MNPDRIANTSTACLLVLKALFLLIVTPWSSISAIPIFMILMFGLAFHTGMITIADAITGQKTIRSLSRSGIENVSRDEPFAYSLALAGGIFWASFGAIIVLAAA